MEEVGEARGGSRDEFVGVESHGEAATCAKVCAMQVSRKGAMLAHCPKAKRGCIDFGAAVSGAELGMFCRKWLVVLGNGSGRRSTDGSGGMTCCAIVMHRLCVL